MKKIVTAILVCLGLFALLGCTDDSEIYELQEHCGRAAEQWVKSRPGEILNYRSHYNKQLSKCFIHATLSPAISKNFYSSFDILYDVNGNKEYGRHTINFDSIGSESHQCFIRNKFYGGRSESPAKQRWNEFVKEIMED